MSSIAAAAAGPGVWSLWGVPDPNPTRAATRRDGERIAFDNLGYRISVGDDATVIVLNRATGDHYVFLGEQHDEATTAGAHTLRLDDGTKLTIEIAAEAGAAPGSKVAISNHDYGVQVLGVAGGVAGDLRYIETASYGWALDAAVRDGLGLDERTLAQAPGPWHVVRAGELGPGAADADTLIGFVLREMFMTLAVLMTITMAGAFTGAWAPRLGAWARESLPAEREREAPPERLPRGGRPGTLGCTLAGAGPADAA